MKTVSVWISHKAEGEAYCKGNDHPPHGVRLISGYSEQYEFYQTLPDPQRPTPPESRPFDLFSTSYITSSSTSYTTYYITSSSTSYTTSSYTSYTTSSYTTSSYTSSSYTSYITFSYTTSSYTSYTTSSYTSYTTFSYTTSS
ncbi:unnamed protein product [Gadus morhua 'NCC']